MSDSAGTPGSGSNSTSADTSTNSPPKGTNSTLLNELVKSNAPPPSDDSSSSAPPPNSGSPQSPPPSGSPPAPPPQNSSPPPSSPPPSSPPPSSSSSSPPPSSPPPSSPPPSSPPPSSSEKSPSNQPSPSPNPPSPPPPEKSGSSPSNGNNSPESSPTWSPPPPPSNTPPGSAASPPPPTTNADNQSPPANATNALRPPTNSGASAPKSSRGNTSGTSPTKSSSSSSSSSSSAQSATIIGATAAGVFLLAFIAILFVVRGRKKKRDAYTSHYMPPPNNYSGNSGGYYYSHSNQHPMGHSGPVDPFYGSQVHPSPLGNSYGSQKGYGGPDSGINSSKNHFGLEEMMEITNGFSHENVIGEGGFGCVYKGTISDGRVVAIKQLKAGSGQGEREFRAEVEIISRVHHRHLVSLVGYCIADQHRLLIYEFLPNKTLEHHLHAEGLAVLDWTKRMKIAIGSAKGLAYLHEDCHPKIIHRDIKSANILLDNDFEAQVADFGLARLNDTTQTHVSTRVMGTFGYLAPEYASSGKLTDRSDVFSFGVVLLELITGRKPVDASQPLGDESLVEWARPLLVQALETGDISQLVDPRLGKQYVEIEMFKMIEAAAACVRHSAPKRPRMVKVVRALDTDEDMADLSNGVKYGQSTIYDSGQYNQEILKFRRMALGMDDSCDFSGEYNSRDMSLGPPSVQKSREASIDFNSSESETRAINQQSRFGGHF